ncbi:lipid A biosynthesis acyltransferase [Marinicauda salina]|uniref:Lipid A biosynthesis acyltransferase n=1 Tax=Marinicauda salina TaxID=2135793 RepID=A0A2U2BUI6_9PROT|nr:lysophospholipid acyltransferase family protein [Marinicauda salina]PWE17695.1 lipid A biosynthesis acyltransferase [Marinicauda salina]
MTSLLQNLGWRAEALGWDAYQGLFRSMGLERASDAGARLLRMLGPRTKPHHIARVNMQIAFPDAHPRELDQLLDRMWDNFGRLAGEFPNLHRFDLSPDSEHVEFHGREVLEEMQRTGQPAVLISGHLANWELMPAMIMRHLPTCRITYRHANNPFIDRRIVDQREAYGVKIFAPKGGLGAKEIMKALGEGHSVALLNDQKMNDGIAAPFFGREAMTASGPARMALRFRVPLLPMSVRRIEGVRFRMQVHEPIELPEGQGPEAVRETVTRINRFMEDRINEAPAQWFWVHRRFDKAIYRGAES